MLKTFPLILVLFCASVPPLVAQETPQEVSPLALPKPSNFVAQFLHDQGEIWSSPLRIKRNDLKWIAPIGVGAAALFSTDSKVSDAVRRSEDLQSPSRFISHFG